MSMGLPEITIRFTGLGATAVQRGSKGTAVLLLKDIVKGSNPIKEYRTILDFDETERKNYSTENVTNILDALEETPKRLIVGVFETSEDNGSLNTLLKEIDAKTEMNCWIAIADSTEKETSELVSFVKASNKERRKKYKALVYKGLNTDSQHITNLTNERVSFADERGTQEGSKAIPYILGLICGYTLDMSLIAKRLQKFSYVEEPEDIDESINKGEFVLINDEGDVRVARAINSLVTTGQGITEDMRYILITEVMDLIYTDIYRTWKDFYQGKYKNVADNQMLFIGAVNAYFKTIASEDLLDRNFENISYINLEKQRLANIPKYGEVEVNSWTDDKVKEMTVGTQIFPNANIKVLNAMEDIDMEIFM